MLVEPLEDEDRQAGLGEVGRGDEAVVAAADDDDVVPVAACSAKSRWHATGRRYAGIGLPIGTWRNV